MPETSGQTLIPPVIEVALGVAFDPLPDLGAVGLARLAADWQEDYPIIREVPGQPTSSLAPPAIIQLGTGAPPSRLWLLSEDENELLQLQNDTVLINWRRMRSADVYPEHEKLLQRFETRFEAFKDKTSRHGTLNPRLVEWTYVNRLESSEALTFIDGALEKSLPGVSGSFEFRVIRELRDGHRLAGYLSIVGAPAMMAEAEPFYALTISTKLSASEVGLSGIMGLLRQAHGHSYSAFTSVVRPRLRDMRGSK